MIFDKAMMVYPLRTTKNPSKIMFLVPLQAWSSPLTLVYKIPFFESLKRKYLWNLFSKFKK